MTEAQLKKNLIIAIVLGVILLITFILIRAGIKVDAKLSPEERKRRNSLSPSLNEQMEKSFKESEKISNKPIAELFGFIGLGTVIFYILHKMYNNEWDFGFGNWAVIAIIVAILWGIINEVTPKTKKSTEKNIKSTQYETGHFDLDNFFAGKMSLAKCFWFYYMLVGIVIGYLCGYFAGTYDQKWLLIFPIAYYSAASVSLWNCATLYSNAKLENKQHYGWAIAAKIIIAINGLALISQTYLILGGK